VTSLKKTLQKNPRRDYYKVQINVLHLDFLGRDVSEIDFFNFRLKDLVLSAAIDISIHGKLNRLNSVCVILNTNYYFALLVISFLGTSSVY
jgi:hypothetical protein